MPVTSENLPRTTAERLRRVADKIETEPETWNQNQWMNPGGSEWRELFVDGPLQYLSDLRPRHAQGRNGTPCGTTCCQAGWLVRYTPTHIPLPYNWGEAGAIAGGLAPDLAAAMFSESFADFPRAHVTVAHLLRRLADVDEIDRNLATVHSWMADDAVIADLAYWI